MKYGVDVAATRLDDLDKRVLATVRQMVSAGVSPRVLDVGCGQGGLVAALVAAGAAVVALDIDDYRDLINERLEANRLPSDGVIFVQADIRQWLASHTELFDMVVLQRVLHYLTYEDAVAVLTALHRRANKLFGAVSGLATAIGEHYEMETIPIEERWGRLDTLGQELFSITAPVCLYTEEEVRELLAKTGWEIEWLRVSDFGNIKVVALNRL